MSVPDPSHNGSRVGYALGVDIGTTFTAAAVANAGQVISRAPSIPSVVFLGSDESILTGEAANRRSLTEPDRVAREFKRRVGDPTPILVSGAPFSAERLLARLLRWTVDAIAEREGIPARRVAVCHPANWGPYKLDLRHQAIGLAGLDDAELVTEPVAAAAWYASAERVDVGDIVVVYDLGGGTFDVCVLRRSDDGFEIIGEPDGIERLGGIDFDAAVFSHVTRTLGSALDDLDADDPTALAAVARLRQECGDAKESLSSDTETTIPILLPTVQTQVRLTRAEFEAMIRPTLTETIESLRRALDRAGVAPPEVRSVLLVGGSSRIPLVGHLVSDAFDRPVSVDAHPKHAIALGAVLWAARRLEPADAPAMAAATAGSVAAAAGGSSVAEAPAARAPAAGAPVAPPDGNGHEPPQPPEPEPGVGGAGSQGVPSASPSGRRAGNPVVLLAAALVGLAVVGVVAALGLGGGNAADDPPGERTAGTTATTAGTTVTAADQTDTTAAAASAPLCTGPSGRCARIQGITRTGDTYVVDFAVSGHTPHIDGGPDSHHVHFFFDTVAPENAGTNGPAPGVWFVYDGPDPFTGYGVADRPAGADRRCMLVADVDHGFELGRGNCTELPA